ncbi:hypothetical protein [Aliiroseovarius sp. F47248L]|uniref:hypothetical protein n=1 Tax=Aliiroseovarius sp. F47248L TaxID=2926420 RepID=UPI001FF6D5CD|nr:hypothetical protein [Aliiroseovarius sp. F47248L]MCK0138239.1 hypothetical protein [Aliiroseovarius sp. F47248L]
MSDISELETRITTALERISSGLAALSNQSGGSDDDVAQLKAQLDEEQTANSQLSERVKALQQSRADEVDKLRGELGRLTAQLETDEVVLSKMRQVNADLRANNDALRKAIADGDVTAELVNDAMAAELEGLRVAQSADRAELDAVLGELGQLINDSSSGAKSQTSTGGEGADA